MNICKMLWLVIVMNITGCNIPSNTLINDDGFFADAGINTFELNASPNEITKTDNAGLKNVQKVGLSESKLANQASKTRQNTSNEAVIELAKRSGCFACHSFDRKVVGPAWNMVAERYKSVENIREKLIKKISKGGKGNWNKITGGVPMPPYSPRVSDKNIEKLVDFVLSL